MSGNGVLLEVSSRSPGLIGAGPLEFEWKQEDFVRRNQTQPAPAATTCAH